MVPDLQDKIRAYCLSLPETTEGLDAFGHISFRVNDKPFIMIGKKADNASIAIKTELTTQEFLLAKEDTPYTKTAYIGHHGWVSITESDADWNELQDLIMEGYYRAAPKRLVRALKGINS